MTCNEVIGKQGGNIKEGFKYYEYPTKHFLEIIENEEGQYFKKQ